MRCKNQWICLIVLQPLGICLVAYKKGRNSFVEQKDDKKLVGRTGIKRDTGSLLNVVVH